jgi:deoxyadenosine/deoxycytidine kinase
MAKLIAVIGNCGSGKTALTKRLTAHYGITPLLEQHAERPFQARFQSQLKTYALANQVDYLLFRAEQEHALRLSGAAGIADGGLDQDFHVFTRLFRRKGLLDEREYALCERLYRALRRASPPPDLLIRLTAPLDVLARRRAVRTRALDIVTEADLPAIDELLAGWMSGSRIPVIEFDTSADDPDYSRTAAPLLRALDGVLEG